MSARSLAWLVFAPTILLFAGFAALVVLDPTSMGEDGDSLNVAVFTVFVLAFAGVGALIVSRHVRNAVGWLMVASALSFALAAFAGAWAHYGITNPGALPWPTEVGWLTTWAWGLGAGLAPTFLVLLFPDGRLPSRRWAPVAWFAGGSLALLLASVAFAPGPLDASDYPDAGLNPFGLPGAAGALETLEDVSIVALLGSILACLASLAPRWRRAGPVQRAQLRWLTYAAAAVVFGIIASTAIEIVYGSNDAAINVGNAIITGSLSVIPVAIGFAILRHRLYDIDVVINRTLVYGALSACLAGSYLAGVLVLGRLLAPVTRGSELAIAGSTLAVAALFRPLRTRIQEAVDRRFYRHKYDAARTLESFSARLRDDVDLDLLADELQGVARETMQPQHVSLWLRGRRRGPEVY